MTEIEETPTPCPPAGIIDPQVLQGDLVDTLLRGTADLLSFLGISPGSPSTLTIHDVKFPAQPEE